MYLLSLQCFDTVGWATGGLLVVTIWLEFCTSCSSSCLHHP